MAATQRHAADFKDLGRDEMPNDLEQCHLDICVGGDDGDHCVALHKRWVSIASLFISTNTVYLNPLLKQLHSVFDIDSLVHQEP